MREPVPRGMFIVFEGIDGTGKTTQVALLERALVASGKQPVVSREPTTGPWGTLIRESANSGRLSPAEELQAFLNDRSEHVETLIRPALQAGKIVVLDRYFYSSIAYQGSRGANVAEVEHLMKSRFPLPDAVFILDADPETSLHRIAHSRREQPNEFERPQNLARVREIFRAMNGPEIHHLDASQQPEAVHGEVMRVLGSVLS